MPVNLLSCGTHRQLFLASLPASQQPQSTHHGPRNEWPIVTFQGISVPCGWLFGNERLLCNYHMPFNGPYPFQKTHHQIKMLLNSSYTIHSNDFGNAANFTSIFPFRNPQETHCIFFCISQLDDNGNANPVWRFIFMRFFNGHILLLPYYWQEDLLYLLRL